MRIDRRGFVRLSAFAAASPGVPCEAVDAAARKVITDAGFAVRIEDCMYITEQGAKFFSQPSPSIDQACA